MSALEHLNPRKVWKYFEEINNDIKSALACLGKVIEVYPVLSGVMRYYLDKIKEGK